MEHQQFAPACLVLVVHLIAKPGSDAEPLLELTSQAEEAFAAREADVEHTPRIVRELVDAHLAWKPRDALGGERQPGFFEVELHDAEVYAIDGYLQEAARKRACCFATDPGSTVECGGRRRPLEFRIGCSGWSYKHWRGDFYPKGVPARLWFEHYADEFDTVELNTTFYRLPLLSTVRNWDAEAPEGFKFATKASRLITHYRRLQNCEDELHNFFERVKPLGEHAGPYLYQLPRTFKRDDDVLRGFLKLLPPRKVHAFEFRHNSWWHDDIYQLLRDHKAVFVMFDQGEVETPAVATGDDIYVRFHGPGEKYSGSYTRPQLRKWCERIRELRAKRSWVYFNNDIGGHAPKNAKTFRELAAGR